MAGGFFPPLDILPAPQRRLWNELTAVPAEFLLYGETAVALHLGHRHSVDFDFFGSLPFNPASLAAAIPFPAAATITQREPNTLSGSVDRGGPVRLSFFGLPAISRLERPSIAPGNGLQVAGLLDLAGTKASVVQQRAEAKDYIDVAAILHDGRIDLPTALAAARATCGGFLRRRRTTSPGRHAMSTWMACPRSFRCLSLPAETARPAVKPIPLNEETRAIARRVVWFEEPPDALDAPIRFMA